MPRVRVSWPRSQPPPNSGTGRVGGRGPAARRPASGSAGLAGRVPSLTSPTWSSDFLDASAERERDEVRELAERAARDKRNNRRLRWAVAGAGVLLVAAIFGGGLAAVRGGEAELSAENARVEALVATSLALLDNDRETAALLAAEAFRRWPQDPRVRSALWGVVTSTGGFVETHREEGALSPGFAMIPNTSTALRVTYREDDAIRPTSMSSTSRPARSSALTISISPRRCRAGIRCRGERRRLRPQRSRPRPPDQDRIRRCCWNHVTFLDLTTGETPAGDGPSGSDVGDTWPWTTTGAHALRGRTGHRRRHRDRHDRPVRFARRAMPRSTSTPCRSSASKDWRSSTSASSPSGRAITSACSTATTLTLVRTIPPRG